MTLITAGRNMTKKNEVIDALTNLTGNIPVARKDLSETEIDALIQEIGPRTAKSILSMRGKTQESRIPFLFSSVDTQAIVDLLANDCGAAIERALAAKNATKKLK